MLDFFNKYKSLVVAAVFAACVAPTFISYQSYSFTWDDSDYLQRSIALSRAFWSWDSRGIVRAMVSVRPPIMTLMGLPWGPMASWDAAGKCFISLAAMIALLAGICLYLLLRIGVKPVFLIGASLCVCASLGPFLVGPSAHGVFPPGAFARWGATGFLADSVLAWITLSAVLLIPYEARTRCTSIRGDILRGILWGIIFSLGAMTKIDFLYFIYLIVPALVLIRIRNSGLRSALDAFASFAFCSAPAIFYFIKWGRMDLVNALGTSFGPVAKLYHIPLLQFLNETLQESPGIALALVITVSALVYLVIRRREVMRGPDFFALLIIICFGAIVLASSHRDIRYEFPVIVSAPFLTAVLLSGKPIPASGRSATLAAILAFSVLTLSSLPMRHRASIQSLSRPEAVLSLAANCHAKSILLATDSPNLNEMLMGLAETVTPMNSPVKVKTLAYNAVFSIPIKTDLQVISNFDLVVLQDHDALYPEFTNQRFSDYEQYLRTRHASAWRRGDLTIYLMH